MNKFEKTLHFIKDVIHEDSPFYGQIYLVGGCVRDELLATPRKNMSAPTRNLRKEGRRARRCSIFS